MELVDDELRPSVRLAQKIIKFPPQEEWGPRPVAFGKALKELGAVESPGKQRLTAAAGLSFDKFELVLGKVAPDHSNLVNASMLHEGVKRAAGLSSALVTSRGGGGSISAPSAASTQEDVHVRSVGKRLRGPAYTIINAEADDCRRKRLHWSALSVPVAKDGRVRTQPVGTLNRAAAGGQKTWVKTSEV